MTTSQNTTEEAASDRSVWSRPFVTLMLMNLLNMMGGFMASTTLPLYLTGLGVEVAMVGVVVGAFSISAIAVRPFAGPAFDSLPRKGMIIGTSLICVISLAGYAFASDSNLILAIRLFHGVGIGCSGPLLISLVGEFVPKAKLATGISTFAVSTYAAQVVGPATGLFLVDLIGFRATYLLCAALVLGAVACVTTIKEPHRDLLPYKVNLDRVFCRETLDKALVMALFATSFATVGSYLVLMTREYGIDNVGFYFAIYALALIVVAPRYGKLSDRIGPERVLILGSLAFAASFVMLHFAHTVPMLVVTALVSSFGYGACSPLIQSLAMSSVDKSRSAIVNNTHYTGLDLGMMVGPAMAGFVAEALVPVSGSLAAAYSNMFLVMIIPMALGFCIILYWNVKRSRRDCNQQASRA